MKNVFFTIIIISCIGKVYAFPNQNFNQGDLDGASQSTIGNTQTQLAQRGYDIECLNCHGVKPKYQGVIETSDIISQTTSATFNCLGWKPVGICIWMSCVGPVCAFDLTVKVKNFVPDLTIQSYDRADAEPWTQSHDINEYSQGDADSSWVTTIISWIESTAISSFGIDGGTSTEAKKDKHSNLKFKLVDAYGNPGLLAFNALASSSFGLICDGKTWTQFPYFISNLDSIQWRWDFPEMFYPQSSLGGLAVGIYDLGGWSNNYGPIYPRHGFTISADPFKAAVLSVFRAAHVITRSSEPHVYWTIDQGDSDGYWPADPLDQNKSDTGQFQMLYPSKESSCRSFPYAFQPNQNKRDSVGNYVWNFWKSYKCCEKGGDQLVFHSG